MAFFRRRPTTIEAVQWDGRAETLDSLRALGATFRMMPRNLHLLAGKAGAQGEDVIVPVGHWVAKAASDDFYPIDPEVFAATYEPASKDDEG